MSAKFTRKKFETPAYYHVYNRGVIKSPLFFDEQDFRRFRKIIRTAIAQQKGNVVCDVFCLLDNHYHLGLYQKSIDGIRKVMHSAMTRYSLYFNKKYKRVGRVFERPYCAAIKRTPLQILNIRNYVLLNPIRAGKIAWEHVGRNI